MPSKTGYLQRYLTIIQKVRMNKYISMNKLIDAVQHEMAFFDDNVGLSESTIRRDLREIRGELYLDIKYSKAMNGYYIDEGEGLSDIEMMLEPLNLLSVLYMDKKLPHFLFTEKRKSKGMEYLPLLIHAIKNSLVTEFLYVKYDNTLSHIRRVEPYALKEFKGRWYLLAMEVDGRLEERGCIKTWGLDRIKNFNITQNKFWKNTEYDLHGEFADTFPDFDTLAMINLQLSSSKFIAIFASPKWVTQAKTEYICVCMYAKREIGQAQQALLS